MLFERARSPAIFDLDSRHKTPWAPHKKPGFFTSKAVFRAFSGLELADARQSKQSDHRFTFDIVLRTIYDVLVSSSSQAMKLSYFRLPANLIKRLDVYARELRDKQPGARFTRSDAVRLLLEEGLQGKGFQK